MLHIALPACQDDLVEMKGGDTYIKEDMMKELKGYCSNFTCC